MVTAADLLKIKGAEVYSTTTSATIREVLLSMAEKDVGALPVLDGMKLSGILSERDFAKLLAKEGAFSPDTSIQDIMTKKLVTVVPATSIEECMWLMTEKHIRHLPVLENDQMVGLISISDVVKTIISSQKDFIDQLEGNVSSRW